MFRAMQYLFVLFIIVWLTRLSFGNNLNQQCGIRQVSVTELVLRGKVANPGYWPWYAIIYHRENHVQERACGGTLISKKFVLTAKHCVITSSTYKMNVKNIFIQLGVHHVIDLDLNAFQQHRVQEIFLAPGSPELRHDIALIELKSDARLTHFVQPACIETRNIIGAHGTAIGFGLTETGEMSDVLKECTMPVVDGYECVQSDRDFGLSLDETVVCAGHVNTSGCKVCNGDSGGGLHFNRDGVWYVGGIISFSPSDDNKVCKSTGFAAFTRVDKYLTWIENITLIPALQQQSSGNMTDPNILRGGNSCTLSSGGAGQCQTIRECSRMYSDERNICGFIGHEPIVCCDVVRRHCDGIQPSKNRFARVVGVTNVAKDGEFPFIAQILIESNHTITKEFSHTAVLISKRFLLIAAHIFRPYSVKLGSSKSVVLDPYVDTYLIEHFHRHEEYKKSSKQNDIAIIKVARDILLNEFIKPICVYNHPEDLSESVDLSLMGWGQGNDGKQSSKLLKGIVHSVPRATCQTSYKSNKDNLTDTQICAIGDTNEEGIATDSCHGDSGGPLVLKENNKNYLVAITSFGLKTCGVKDVPSVYTRVFKFLPWLIEKGVFNNH